MMKIGIDLGTTNSLIAYWNGEEAKLIPNKLGKTMTPSIVGLDHDGKVLIGDIAKERLITHPDKTISEFKRYMGTDKAFKLGKKTFRAEELSAFVIKQLIDDAESALNQKVTSVVVSVPAYFSDAQRKATRDAGRLAGVEVKRLINEPTAAAIAYGLHEKGDEHSFLVFDLGGGTFDVSILELFDGVMQVNASAGDNRLGGEDFSNILLKHILSKQKWQQSKLSSSETSHLRNVCEQLKRQLTVAHQAEAVYQYKSKEVDLSIDRDTFEQITADLVARLRVPLERALQDADIQGGDLDAVVLVGGGSRMPIIRSTVSKLIGRLPHAHINPDEIVALGAAVQAALIEGDQSLKEVILTDVAPYTLGVGIVNDTGLNNDSLHFHPIIERNSAVPISRVDTLYSASDYQTELTLVIYQGEARLVKDNIKLGELTLKVPRALAGKESVDVRFTYDISGLLEVDAKVNSTGMGGKVVIEGNPGTLSEKDILKRLAELEKIKIHPREETENRLLLARGERLYEIAKGDLREYIANVLSQFEKILQQQNADEIQKASVDIKGIFDDIEKQSPIL